MRGWIKKLSLTSLVALTPLTTLCSNEPSNEWAAVPSKEQKKNQNHFSSVSFDHTKQFLTPTNAFFEFNVGLGFVYFSGIEGDLSGQPSEDFRPFNYTALKRKLTVNRGPAFDTFLGHRFNQWFSAGLNYQYQGQLAVKSTFCPSSNALADGLNVSNVFSQFQADLSLNAALAKFYIQSPIAFVAKGLTFTPYLGAGVGAAWQSWTRLTINRQFTGGASDLFFSEPQFLRQKISANAAWVIDAGINVLRVKPSTDFSLKAGCRFTDYGQARSMGKITQQDSFKGGLVHPIGARMVYSFTPYLGIDWQLPIVSSGKKPLEIKGKNPNTSKPFFASTKLIEAKKSGFTLFSVGPAFIYFSKVRGNLFGRPDTNFGVWGNVPLKGVLSVNKVPLLEALWGYQFAPWIKGALSYQHFSGAAVQTKMLNGQTLSGSSGESDYSQFQATLAIDAALVKAYFFIPKSFVVKNTATTPYISVGGGVSWQSWTRMQVNRSDRDTVGYNADPQPIRLKVMANGSFLVDAGFRFQSLVPQNNFSLNIGCKYNQWGQARNIGKLSDQGSLVKGLNHPLRVKTLYSFTPYLGAQWNFPVLAKASSAPQLKGRSVARFLPFFTHNREIQAAKSPFVQFNVGAGFLYFDQVGGSLTGTPTNAFAIFGPIQIKQGFIYNRSPLFEYQVGYRFNQWIKAALSYQYQAGITFQTQILDALTPDGLNTNFDSRHSQFQANLALNSLMAKVYFELPLSMVSSGCAFTPYLGAAVGPGWQNWTQVQVNRMYDIQSFVSDPQSLRQKVSGNAVWMLDAGMRVQSALSCSPFSVTMGCKYIQWGQARNMGAVKDQETIKFGLIQPIRIKTLYSFAPYLGMQWNF